jgi:hypothetical protein
MMSEERAVTAKRRTGWAVVASVLWLLAAGGASAQQSHRQGPGRNLGGDRPQRLMPVEVRPEPGFLRDAAAPGGGNRLSPEERRQLRRDVHDAGRDLYLDRERLGRRGPRGD